MDGGVALTPDEIKGRNMWMSGRGGNDRFWDHMTDYTFGAFDLLKIVCSHPEPQATARANRWQLSSAWSTSPASRRRPAPTRTASACGSTCAAPDCPPDPFENESKYPGVAIGARGKARRRHTLPVGSFYGWATGIVGLRLFPNPAFDEKAAKEWDAERYYTDPSYYNRKDLVRPYRVGMSCGFCHVGPSPVKPPADPEQPEVGEPELDGRRAVLLGRPALHLRREQARGRRTSCTSSSTPRGRARWTPRWSRPTTSTTRAR